MKDSRRFGVEVMNRAGLAFGARDVALAARVVEQLEAEIAVWLARQFHDVVVIDDVIAAVHAGEWRGGDTV